MSTNPFDDGGPTTEAEDRYTDFYASQARSPTLRAIYRDAYGEDYPEELDPVVDAARRSVGFGLMDSRFSVGSFTATGLPPSSCSAVMSVDALWMVWNKKAAVADVARILGPGGRFVFTSWEPEYIDHMALLEEAGFSVLVREETPDWLSRQRAVYDGIVAASAELRRELGDRGASVLTRRPGRRLSFWRKHPAC